ncbi:MAG: L-fucose isomerase [Haloarculaceae archaeon]
MARDQRFPHPKIGIRPAIDARGGVREAETERTMAMAERAADLLESELRHPDGEAVECVVADHCIGRAPEANDVRERFEREGVGVSLTVSPVWCYGSETMDTDPHVPKAVWGLNAPDRPGAVYLAALKAAHDQKGLPIFPIYGEDAQVTDEETVPDDVRGKLLRFGRAGLAVATMRDQSYLSVGGVSMGIGGSVLKEEFFEKYLGMRTEHVDMSEVARRLEAGIYDDEEFERAMAWVDEHCEEGADPNPPELQLDDGEADDVWETTVKMTLILRDLMVGNEALAEAGYDEEALGHDAIAAGFQGQREWTDGFPNGDFPETVLNTTFDWNGPRAPYLLATENDTLNAATMLFGHLLTDAAQLFVDVRTYWSPDAVEDATGRRPPVAEEGLLHLKNSGPTALDGTGEQAVDGEPAMKPFWDVTDEEREACLDAASFHPAHREYFRGGGYSTQFVTEGGMPMTMARLNIVDGLGPVLQVAEGRSVDLPAEVHETLDEATDPTWPTTWFVPKLTGEGAFTDVYSVMDNWGSNHGALSYGHVGDDLLTLASMLRIPVNMHNVEDERVFRPSAWSAFGTDDPEGADYRACENFGPLYD